MSAHDDDAQPSHALRNIPTVAPCWVPSPISIVNLGETYTGSGLYHLHAVGALACQWCPVSWGTFPIHCVLRVQERPHSPEQFKHSVTIEIMRQPDDCAPCLTRGRTRMKPQDNQSERIGAKEARCFSLPQILPFCAGLCFEKTGLYSMAPFERDTAELQVYKVHECR